MTGKSDDKYRFFMKATELSRIDRTFDSTCQKIEELEESNFKLKKSLEQKAEQVNELKRKFEEHKKLDKEKAKHLQYQASYFWAYYEAAEKEYFDALDMLKRGEEKTNQREQEIADIEALLAKDPKDEEDARRKKVEDLVQEAQTQAEIKQQLENRLRELLLPQKKLERELQALRKQRKDAQKRLSTAKQRLEEARQQILDSSNSESEDARRMAALKKAEEELEACKEKTNGIRQNVSSSLRAYEEMTPHVQDAKTKVENISRQLHGLKTTIQNLESASGDSLAILGPNVKKMFEQVSDHSVS